MSRLIFTWGKFQPPHVGHMKIVNMVKQLAEENECDYSIFTPLSKDYPLTNEEKILVLRKAFGEFSFVFPKFSDVIDFIVDCEYESAIMVIGEDRLADFQRMLPVFEKEARFPVSLKVISGGKRDKEATGIEGMSSTKMRNYAKTGKKYLFRDNLPSTLSGWWCEFLYNKLRNAK